VAGRIRTIKPELLTDSKAARLSDTAWRMFVSALLLADDHGRLPADDVVIGGQVFPGRSFTEASRALTELSRVGLVDLYEVRGQRYAAITGWAKHQRVERPSGPRFPAPGDGIPVACGPIREPSPKPREDSPQPHRILATDPDPDPDPDLREPDKPPGWDALSGTDRRLLRQHLAPAGRLWALQDQLRRELGGRALKPTAERLLRVAKRLDAGASESDCEAVLRRYRADASKRPESAEWFNGETNWRPLNFDRTLGMASEGARQAAMDPIAEALARANREEASP
jgi:hypothetical protein